MCLSLCLFACLWSLILCFSFGYTCRMVGVKFLFRKKFIHFIHTSSCHLPLYDTQFEALIDSIFSLVFSSILGFSIFTIHTFPLAIINALFNDFIFENYPNCWLVFVDSSASNTFAIYSILIPSILIKFSNGIHLSASSLIKFITEYLAFLKAFFIIKSLVSRLFLIVSDSQSCLLS